MKFGTNKFILKENGGEVLQMKGFFCLFVFQMKGFKVTF